MFARLEHWSLKPGALDSIPSNWKPFTPLFHLLPLSNKSFIFFLSTVVSQAFTCFSVSDCRGDVVRGVGRPGDCCARSGLSFLTPNEGCTNCFRESALQSTFILTVSISPSSGCPHTMLIEARQHKAGKQLNNLYCLLYSYSTTHV